jgi:hypothetical protein
MKHTLAAVTCIAIAVLAGGSVALGGLFSGRTNSFFIVADTASNTSILLNTTSVTYTPLKLTYNEGYLDRPYIAVVHPLISN